MQTLQTRSKVRVLALQTQLANLWNEQGRLLGEDLWVGLLHALGPSTLAIVIAS